MDISKDDIEIGMELIISKNGDRRRNSYRVIDIQCDSFKLYELTYFSSPLWYGKDEFDVHCIVKKKDDYSFIDRLTYAITGNWTLE